MPAEPPAVSLSAHPPPNGARSLVLVGLMGAGKTAVGRRVARALGLNFVDSDREIEAAAGLAVRDIFELYGEPAFRDLERRVVARLLEAGPRVLALGGGAFVDPHTREAVRRRGVAVWLRASPETLARRTGRRRGVRPLLNGADPLATLRALAERRDPLYAEADIWIDGDARSVEEVAADIVGRLDPRGRPPLPTRDACQGARKP